MIELNDFKNSRERKEHYADEPNAVLVSRVAYLEKQIAYVIGLEAAKGLEHKTLEYSKDVLTKALLTAPKKPGE